MLVRGSEIEMHTVAIVKDLNTIAVSCTAAVRASNEISATMVDQLLCRDAERGSVLALCYRTAFFNFHRSLMENSLIIWKICQALSVPDFQCKWWTGPKCLKQYIMYTTGVITDKG